MIQLAVKKPVEVKVLQWTGDNSSEIISFCGEENLDMNKLINENELVIKTLEGNHFAIVSDYIICGVHGEFYPCKEDIFLATYNIKE